MPLYTFYCEHGHHTDLVRPIGTETESCPRCGSASVRGQVYHTHVVGPTVDTRGKFRLFREATAEIDYAHTKTEQDQERSIASPRIYSEAKQQAQAMIAAGEAPLLRDNS